MTAAAVRKFRGCDYMPLKLKAVLLRHGISQPKLAEAILQKNGVPLSPTSISFLVNGGYFPKSTPEADVKAQAEEFLRAKGVSTDELATIWEQDGEQDLRNSHPVGAHLSAVTKSSAAKAAKLAEIRETTIDPVEIEMLTPDAKRHFKLFRDPFKDDINGPNDVFVSTEQRYITEAMFQTAKHGGILAVPGESGSGKTTLRKLLLERIKGQSIRIIFPQTVDKKRLSTGSICQAIIRDLAPGMTVKSDLEDKARQVVDVLLQSAQADFSHALLIEEAHDLSIDTLKYLKRFHEMEDGFKKLLSIILIGQQELKKKLDESQHPEAREFIRRCEIAELLPLGEDLERYLAHKFKCIGISVGDVLGPDAYDGIRGRLTKSRQGETFSQLYPLSVNNLVTKGMNKAAKLGIPLVTADVLRGV